MKPEKELKIVSFLPPGKDRRDAVGCPSLIVPAESEGGYCEYWFQGGKKDRRDGPAVTKRRFLHEVYWYRRGWLHRREGPAESYGCSSGTWYVDGRLHRRDGPAFDGVPQIWYWLGFQHRIDGPADGTSNFLYGSLCNLEKEKQKIRTWKAKVFYLIRRVRGVSPSVGLRIASWSLGIPE